MCMSVCVCYLVWRFKSLDMHNIGICVNMHNILYYKKVKKTAEGCEMGHTSFLVVLFVENSGAEIIHLEMDCKYKNLRTDDKTTIIGINKNII